MRAPDDYRYTDEASIFWLKPEAKSWPYLRESVQLVRSRRGRKRFGHWDVAAVSVLRPDAVGQRTCFRYRVWHVRVWYLASHDHYQSIGGPSESCDPKSIQPGKPTRSMTDNQWNRQSGYQKFVRPSPVSDPLPRMWN